MTWTRLDQQETATIVYTTSVTEDTSIHLILQQVDAIRPLTDAKSLWKAKGATIYAMTPPNLATKRHSKL